MSERYDDLNQWRNYGDKGSGMMLGINSDFYSTHRVWESIFTAWTFQIKLEQLYLDQCIYNYNIQQKMLCQINS